jgi:hypothetical protein
MTQPSAFSPLPLDEWKADMTAAVGNICSLGLEILKVHRSAREEAAENSEHWKLEERQKEEHEALAELEDNECHRTRSFPKTRLHRVSGVKQTVYRADINKVSGWRIHLQYINGNIALKDVIEGRRHDDVLKVIKTKKGRYR